METDTWIERLIVQELSYPDKRYKHNYKPKEASTMELVVTAASLKNDVEDITQTWEGFDELEKEIEDEVEQAVNRLRERGFITKEGEQPLQLKSSSLLNIFEEPNDEQESVDMSPIWTLTDDGLAEAARINDAYTEDLAEIAAQYDDPEDAPRSELLPLLKQYGINPTGLRID